MPIFQYKKGKANGRQISANFSSSEFDCPCDNCHVTLVSTEHVEKLEAYRAIRGRPVKINHGGGYRCAGYQEELRIRGYETSKGTSSHELGLASDLSDGVTPGYELADDAERAGFTNIGVGKTFIHVDNRSGGPRRWTYKT